MEFPREYIYEYKLKNGKVKYYYLIKIPGVLKSIKKRGFNREKDAKLAMRKIVDEIMMGTYFKRSSETFEEVIKEWLKDKKYNIAPSTFSKYKNIVDTHVLVDNDLVCKKISDVRGTDIRNLYIDKVEEEYSQSYINDIVKVVKLIFKFAFENDKINKNVSLGVKVPKSIKAEDQKMEDKIWTTEEVNQFLEGAQEEDMLPAFVTMLFTGIRRQEMLALRWRYIDLDKGYIYIREAITFDENHKQTIGDTKTKNSIRDIQISKRVIDVLREFKRDQNGEDLLLTNKEGGLLCLRHLQRVKDRIVEKLKMKNITIHGFRHTHASLLLEGGVSVKRVQERLGHSKPSITQDIYSHAIPTENDDIAERFEALF